MKKLAYITLFFQMAICTAQTKIIAHKSHSGNADNFSKAYRHNLFDMRSSNFGLSGNQTIIVLDSVIAVNDSVTILKIRESNVCHQFGTDYKKLNKSDFKNVTITLNKNDCWNKSKSWRQLKSEDYYYRNVYPIMFHNKLDEVVFIGFKD